MDSSAKKYYAGDWKPDYSKFKKTGWKLLNKLTQDDVVLDIGCGYNLYKEKLGDRLWGIDVVNKKADQVIAWEDYKPHMDFTVYFILGAFNWGSEEQIEAQVSKLSQDAKQGTRVYWRQSTGEGRYVPMGKNVYPWTLEKNIEWCDKYGFKMLESANDGEGRIYSQWIKI